MSFHLRNLEIGHNRQAICGPINLHIQKGALVAVLGANGAGKTTLLATLAGGIKAFAGTFDLSTNQTIAYLPQSIGLLDQAPVSVRDVVSMGLWAKLGPFGRPCSHDRASVDQAIEMVGLGDVSHRNIGELSGGQIQRALFARLAVQDCDVILLDEPFAALDTKSQNDLFAIIKKWHKSGKTVLVALHDAEIARLFPTWLQISDASATLSHRVLIDPVRGESGLRVITGGVA